MPTVYFIRYGLVEPWRSPQAMVMKRDEKAVRERVGEARQNALRAMGDAGFDIGHAAQVSVDPKLPFMGYTRPEEEGYRIVVSGMAVESGMLEGLLVHEMSHIYRMQTKHPSHDGRMISGVLKGLGKEALSEGYRRKILQNLVNHIEDLYADDVAVAVMKTSGYVSKERLAKFFQDWVNGNPVQPNDATRNAWENASTLVNNARAIAQMARHRLEDVGGKAERENRRLLSALPPAASRHFEYFTKVLTNLKADITEGEFRVLLRDYLNRFLLTVEMLLAASNLVLSPDRLFRQEVDEWASEPPMHGGD